MTDAKRSPIFIHAHFRSGSTYLFHVFRRAASAAGEKLYTAFQEPIHESVMDAAPSPANLEFYSGSGAIPKSMRHPEIGSTYFAEMIGLAHAWVDAADPAIVYDDYFAAGAPQKTVEFLKRIIDAAPARPVICDCRTSLRVSRLREKLGGVHVYLWRNPWDQWWSLKTTDYFEVAHQVIASGPAVPEPVSRMAREIGLPAMHGGSTHEKFRYFYERRLRPAESYQLFYLLWALSLDQAISAADFDINLDRLSEDAAYRKGVTDQFAKLGAAGLDFSDADAPRAAFDEKDAAFFAPLETRVRAILLESGWPPAKIDAVDEMRRKNAPSTINPSADGRLREVILRSEKRDAEIARRFESSAAAAGAEAAGLRQIASSVPAAIAEAVAAVRAEASDNRVRLDALLASALRERDEARVKSLKDLAAAEAASVELASARASETRARSEAADAEARAREFEAEAATQSRDAAAADAKRLAAEDAHARERLLREAETARARELDWEATRARQHAQIVETRLKATLESHSWRLMAPLRWASTTVRRVGELTRNGVRGVARPVLGAGLAALRAAPPLKRALLWVARRTPLGAPFLRFARARPLPTATATLTAGNTALVLSSQIEAQWGRPAQTRTIYYYVDHTIACPVNTGVQRVVRGLAAGLIENKKAVVFVKLSRKSERLVRINRKELQHLGLWNGPKVDPAVYPAGDEEIAIGAHAREDDSWLVIPEVPHINHHGDEPTLDIIMRAKEAKLKTAFVFYDAIPLRRAEFSAMAPRHENYMRALLLADFVAPISRWSGRDFASYLAHHEEADLGASPTIAPINLPGRTDLASSQKRPTAEEKLVLSVGTIETRKNQSALLQAFEAFCAQHPKSGWRLALVGNLHPNMAEDVKAATARNPAIEHLGNISDEALSDLYNRCAFTVFPSVEEGFGLPILESLAYGKPCVCADFGAMAEVAEGGGCIMVDTRRADAIADAITTLAMDKGARERLANEARSRPLENWADYARNFEDNLRRLDSPIEQIGRIFYFVDQTIEFQSNTGIQRVVRGLGRALLEIGADATPVKWDMAKRDFATPTDADLAHIARWNGPAPGAWSAEDMRRKGKKADWLIIPEVLSSPAGPQISDIHDRARALGLKIAWVFHDAIPWKLRDQYPIEATQAHGAYMKALAGADLRLSNSSHTNNDLRRFLATLDRRQPLLFETTLAIPLAGEFSEAARPARAPKKAEGPVRILCVGTVEPRKNHLTLLRAFNEASARLGRKIELTIAGIAPYPELAAEVERLVESNSSIKWLRKVSDQKLRALYDEADFTVYPSIEEGFGLPILESLWRHRPCICRNAGAMLEVAAGGGCLLVETKSVADLAQAIERLASDEALRARLSEEAANRDFPTWNDYASKVARALANAQKPGNPFPPPAPTERQAFRDSFVNLQRRPLLSVCITTYNRAAWLDAALRNLAEVTKGAREDIEVLVVDNASPDNTPEVAARHKAQFDFRYVRNPKNVGMLGNLRVTAHEARGRYVWVLGDDDLAAPGSIEAVIAAIRKHEDTTLIYLNYAYTREDNAANVKDLGEFFASATPISSPCPDQYGTIASFSAINENFFTAIYCLVFRRDHALRAYSQDTSGRPFSTMLTCIPTTHHVLNAMMDKPGVWLGRPQLVVNMNVSWLKYAPIWILERVPEAFDIAEANGAPIADLDLRRRAHLSGVRHWFAEILREDPTGNRAFFDPRRFAARFKHLPEFQALAPELVASYREAKASGAAGLEISAEEFERFCSYERRVDAKSDGDLNG